MKLIQLFRVLTLSLLGALLNPTFAITDGSLLLHYSFENNAEGVVTDLTGNGNDATLLNGAELTTLDTYPVVDLGSDNGYVDMGSSTGAIISTLEDFTVAMYIYIDEAASISGNGFFAWAFSTSDACGQYTGEYIAYRVNTQRYALSTGGWSSEVDRVVVNEAATKGSWQHVVYTQAGTEGTLYVNGTAVATNTVAYQPKDIGVTTYNWLGRPQYSGDNYLKNTLLSDFRLYNESLTESEVIALGADREDMDAAMSRQSIVEAMELLTVESPVNSDIDLPTSIGDDVEISWATEDANVISETGVVTRPAVGEDADTITLTATLSKDGYSDTKTFEVVVLPYFDDQTSVEMAADSIVLDNANCRFSDIELPTEGEEETTITWVSDQPSIMANDGSIVSLPENGSGGATITLTATVSKGSASATRDFEVCVSEDEGFTSYLFAYFIGNNAGTQENIFFALSNDGFNYKALNGGDYIIKADTISDMNGVRDPHILRGPDGYYYMVVTDMQSALGWSSNHAIVLMRSPDLISWTHSVVDIKNKYPEFSDINRAWAPQTIWDEEAGKFMVYFSLASSTQYDIIYYAYANEDFTDLETTPQVLFDNGYSTIDGDIIIKDGEYHLFFKTEDAADLGYKKAVSDHLTGGYVLYDHYLDQSDESVEGACVFKLINENRYVLMYDLYASGKYEFTESTDLENFTVVDDVSMDFHPRHGTVMPITTEEAKRLMDKWGTIENLTIESANAEQARTRFVKVDNDNLTVHVPVKPRTDLSAFDPELQSQPGVTVSPSGAQDFTNGAVTYTLTHNDLSVEYTVTAQEEHNPVLDGFYADPQVMYSNKTKKFYIYPTSDGFSGWGGYYFNVFSSDNLVDWEDEGTIIDMSAGDVAWADGNAWAPTILEKEVDGEYKYYFYFSGNSVSGDGKQIGVAVADDPAGPFVAESSAMITTSPAGWGQQIDPAAFTDPVSGKSYIYWGNSYMAVAELNDDMTSLNSSTIEVITPSGGTTSTYAFREGVYVFYREGVYYFMWSVDDTGAANYHVAYGTSSSPTGPITVASSPIVIIQDAANEIYGTGHNSVIQIPGRDEWYIVYHRINADYLSNGPGYHREVCIDKLEFNSDGTIKQTTPTAVGVDSVNVDSINTSTISVSNSEMTSALYPNPTRENMTLEITNEDFSNGTFTIYSINGTAVKTVNCQMGANTFETESLPSGVYIGILDASESTERFKIIKE